MTPKEKAERYDEALRRARKLKENPTSVFYEWTPSEGDTIADYIFPELKESEDEKIRKAIIKHFKIGTEYTFFSGFSKSEIINWLEKQGEQKPQGKTALEAINEEKVDNANKVEPKDYSSIDPHFGKSIDKIGAKFHEGEWIVHHGTENIYQVVAVIDNQYQLKYGDNYTVQNCADVDRCARLYDVTKDAKDGDVISWDDSKCIALFKNIYDKDSFNSYGFVGHCTGTFEARHGYHDIEGAHPATKEQRDTLMKAITDAGYEFDFEKKELKKIENETEIPFGAKDSELQEATYYIPKGFHAEIDGDKVVIKKGEKPTAWSEEDEYCRHQLIVFCENRMVSDSGAKRCAHWLKSLKNRVQPQLKQEWSEEDEGILDEIIDFLENGTVKLQHDLSLYASWLKSLKDRYAWRASWEQLDALEYHLKHTNENSRLYKETKKLYDQLKKL